MKKPVENGLNLFFIKSIENNLYLHPVKNDHNKDNNKFDNLAAICQRCHLKHDGKQHADNRRYGRGWKGERQLKLEL